jgi:hypothetical protein
VANTFKELAKNWREMKLEEKIVSIFNLEFNSNIFEF